MSTMNNASNYMNSSVMIAGINMFNNTAKCGATMRMNTDGVNMVGIMYYNGIHVMCKLKMNLQVLCVYYCSRLIDL